MKIIAVILLVIGIGLMGTGVYLSHFIEEQTNCPRLLADAERKSSAAKAAMRTPRESAMKEEASVAAAGAESVCSYARQSQQNGLFIMLGGLISMIASASLLIFSRRTRR